MVWSLTTNHGLSKEDRRGLSAWHATNRESAQPGLGARIIEALAKQLDASVEIAGARPGTSVSIVHV